MQETNLSDAGLRCWLEACGLEDVRVIEQPFLERAPGPLTSENEPHQEAEVPPCAE
jgi:hypothetical protein